MMYSAVALYGNGAIMQYIRGRQQMERKSTFMEVTLEKKSMMGISVGRPGISGQNTPYRAFGIPECVPSGKSSVFLSENRGAVSGKLYELCGFKGLYLFGIRSEL